jgi:hypothetical protein
MTVQQKNIVPGTLLGAALTTLHTAPALTRERITNATLCNDTAGAVACTVHIVTSGDAAGSKNKKISAYPVSAGETYTCPELIGRILEPGDFIQALGNGVALDVSAITIV